MRLHPAEERGAAGLGQGHDPGDHAVLGPGHGLREGREVCVHAEPPAPRGAGPGAPETGARAVPTAPAPGERAARVVLLRER